VGGAEQGTVGDAGEGAAAPPVVDQAAPEDVLADAPEPSGLGGPRQIPDLGLVFLAAAIFSRSFFSSLFFLA
jgi:hypothetical protein